MRYFTRLILILAWLLNAAGVVGYVLLRRQMRAPKAGSNKQRFLIVRPYASERDIKGGVVSGQAKDELRLMENIFTTAQEYGNAQVVVVTNHADPGLDEIRRLARPYASLVRVIEAAPMPTGTPSGQMFNHKTAWQVLSTEANDGDILLTTDCDSELKVELLQQVAHAYEDEQVGGVGTYPLYQPGVDVAAMNYVSALNPGMGFLALNSLLRGTTLIIGNFLSVRVGVFRKFGGYDSYSPFEQFVDDVATSKKILSTGKKLTMVGSIRVYNRYASLPSWWERWSRMMTQIKAADPTLFWPSPLPTYGAQVLTEGLLLYALVTKQVGYAMPFIGNLGVNFLYGSLTSAWRDAALSPIAAPLNMVGWLYAVVTNTNAVRWRGVVFAVPKKDKL